MWIYVKKRRKKTSRINLSFYYGLTACDEDCDRKTQLCSCVFRLMNLLEEIGNHQENKTIIFAETKKKVDALTRLIRSIG